jgi:hypothetical protein
MKYLLSKMTAGNVPEIEISEETYFAYKEARNVLRNCLAIEEIYEILISSYIELEKQILAYSTSSMIRNQFDYSDMFHIRLGLNVCFVNLLSSARLYVDQLYQYVRECLPQIEDVASGVKRFFQAEFDECLEYRFMEGLRNYVQHRGLPIHWITPVLKWTDLSELGFLECYTEIGSLKPILAEDTVFKKGVLEELPEKVDLKAFTRRYVESLSNVHASTRELIKESVEHSRRRMEDAHGQYKQVYAESLGLSAYILSDDEKLIEEVPLILDWDDIRVKLQEQNRKLTNLHKRYVTGKIQTDKK